MADELPAKVPPKEEEEYDARPLTSAEIRWVRQQREAEKRMAWLKSSAKAWLIALAAVLGAVVAIQTGFTEIVKFISSLRSVPRP